MLLLGSEGFDKLAYSFFDLIFVVQYGSQNRIADAHSTEREHTATRH